MTNCDELMDFYAKLYDLEEQASEIRKDIQDQLKAEAEELSASPKAVKSGFNLFKKYKNGKSTQDELDDYSSIESAIMSYFANQDF